MRSCARNRERSYLVYGRFGLSSIAVCSASRTHRAASPRNHPAGGNVRAVIFEHAPEDIEFKKERLPDTVVAGTYVYLAAATRAMLTFGTYDRYFAFSPGTRGEFSLLNPDRIAGCRVRLEPLSLEHVGSFSPSDEIVFFTDRPILNHLFVPVRNRIGRRDLPIVGMIHALQGDMTPLIRMILEGELHEHDAIMCSSSTGRQGFAN